MEVTPEYILDINTELSAIITSNWQRVTAEEDAWGRIMKLRPSSSKQEILTWILDTAGIYPQGNGGNIRFDDMAAISTELVNNDFGSGLKLTTNEIEDNQLADKPTVGAMDFAKKWASDRGFESAYFPRKQLFSLIANGNSALAYDGLSFFNSAHPVDPSRPAGPTYSNIITNVGLQPTVSNPPDNINALVQASTNFAKALSTIAAQTFTIAGIPRFLKPKIVACPTTLTYVVRQMIGMAGGASGANLLATTSNVFGSYEFEAPISAPELNALSTSTYYIGCEDIISDELGAFIYSERKAFELQGYPDTQSAAQNRSNIWEWHLKGRNGTLYGNPYLFYQCTS